MAYISLYHSTIGVLIRSLNVVLSWVIRLSTTVRQNPRHRTSIWKKAESRRRSRASRRHALRVYWYPLTDDRIWEQARKLGMLGKLEVR